MVFQDRTLVCSDCGEDFIFSIDDQQYHMEKGYTNEQSALGLPPVSPSS